MALWALDGALVKIWAWSWDELDRSKMKGG